MAKNVHIPFDGSTYQIRAYKGSFENIAEVTVKFPLGEDGYFAFVKDKESFVYWNVTLQQWKNSGVNKTDLGYFFASNTLEFASADLLDDLFSPGDYGIHINAGFNGKTNMNLTVKFASNDGTGGDGDQDYFQVIKFDTGEEFIRKYEHVSTGAGNWSAWESKIALQQWVTANFAAKESGIDTPLSETVEFTTEADTYTITDESAENITVKAIVAGSIDYGTLTADKAVKIINAGPTSITLDGTPLAAGVTAFAIFDFATADWTISTIIDPVIPDYSDIAVDQYTTTGVILSPIGYYKIAAHGKGGTTAGNLIFVNNAAQQSAIGVYKALEGAGSGEIKAIKIASGVKLNVVRVKLGAVYHSEYDGVNLVSLKFSIINSNVMRKVTMADYQVDLDKYDDFEKTCDLLSQFTIINAKNRQFRMILTGGTLETIIFLGYTINWILLSQITDYNPANTNYLICEIRSAGQIYCFWGE